MLDATHSQISRLQGLLDSPWIVEIRSQVFSVHGEVLSLVACGAVCLCVLEALGQQFCYGRLHYLCESFAPGAVQKTM